MVKKKTTGLTKGLERCLLAFYSLAKFKDGPPTTYANLGKKLGCSWSYARYCLEDLARAMPEHIIKLEHVRYAPYRLTIKGRRLAKDLEFQAKSGRKPKSKK